MRTIALLLGLTVAVAAHAGPEGPAGSNAGDSGAALPGMGLSAEANLFTGTAGARFAFDVPAGRANMQPNLALVYAGAAGPGPFGIGWDLPIGRVERSTAWGVPTYDTASDRFVVVLPEGAVELVPIGGNAYASRIDASHVYLTLDSTLNTWTLRDRSGRVYTFGNTPSARIGRDTAHGNPAMTDTFAWYVTRIADLNDNTITVDYTAGVGVTYPAAVHYTGHGSTAGPYVVTFDWFPAATSRLSYTGGFRQELSQELEAVHVAYNTTRLRLYDLVWGSDPASGLPVLQDIEFEGRDPNSVLKDAGMNAVSQHFTYNDPPISGGLLQAFGTQPRNEDLKGQGFRDDDACNNREFADLNGDGLVDLIVVGDWDHTHSWTVYLNQGRDASGYFGAGTPWPAPFKCISATHVPDPNGDRTSYAISAVMDINGDGRPDYLHSDGTTMNVYWNTGSGFSTIPQDTQLGSWVRMTIPAPGRDNETGTIFDMVDVNGDGLPDRVWNGQDDATYDWGRTGEWRVRFNQGDGTFAAGVGVPAPQRFLRYTNLQDDDPNQPITTEDLFDLNGDGLVDKVVAVGNVWKVWFGTGTRFQGQGGGAGGWVWQSPAPAFTHHATQWRDALGVDHDRTDYEVLDVTGDGLPDLVDARSFTTSNQRWNVYVNTGNGFANSALPTTAHNFIRDKRILNDHLQTGVLRLDTFDINGDGYLDTISLPGGSSIAEVWLGHPARHRVGSLSATTSPLGGVTSFTYDLAPATVGVPFPLSVVTEVDRTAPEDPVSAEKTTYDYAYPYYYPGDHPTRRPREFRGFGRVVQTVAGKGSTETEFLQDDARKGRIASVQTSARPPFDPSPGLLSYTLSTWACTTTFDCSSYDDPAHGRYFPILREIQRVDFGNAGDDDTTWNGTGTAKFVVSDYQSDACGNITDETTNDYAANSVVENIATFASIATGCDASLHVCKGVCDRPATTRTRGALSEGTAEQDVVVKTFSYDGVGNLSSMVLSGPGTPTTTLTYTPDGFGNLATRTDPNGLVTTYGYLGDKLYVASTSNTVGGVTLTKSTTFDPAWGGQLTKKVDENGFTTELAYDTWGRLAKVWEHDDAAPPTLGTTAAQPSKQFTYTLGSGERVDQATLVAIEGSLGGGVRYLTTSVYSDSLGRSRRTQSTQEVRGVDQTVVTGATRYGPGGLALAVHAPLVAPAGYAPTDLAPVPSNDGLETTTTYDPFGRVVLVTAPDGAITRMSHRDPRVERVCDPMHEADATGMFGQCVETESDVFKRVIAQRTMFGSAVYSSVANVYSAAGWLLSTTHNGNPATTVRHVYDELGRRVRTADPDSGTWRFAYDLAGNVIYADDPEPNQHVETTYDALSRVVSRNVYLGSDEQSHGTAVQVAGYTYDAAPKGKGRLQSATDSTIDQTGAVLGGTTTTEEGYDARGNPLSILREIRFDGLPPKKFRSSSSYNATVGRIEHTTYPYNGSGPETLHYHYTRGGLLSGMSSLVGGYVRDLQRDEFGRIVQVTYANGVQDTATYRDPRGQGALDAQPQVGAGGTLERLVTQRTASPAARDVWYELYDIDGKVQAIEDLLPDLPGTVVPAPWVANTVATYDDGKRLTSAQQCAAGGYSGSYDTDADGRLTLKDGLRYYYDDGTKPHQVTRVQNLATGVSENIAYDGDGGMTELPGGRRAYYDPLGRLIRVTQAGHDVARYAYDADGNRVASWTQQDGRTFFFGGFDIRGGRVYRHFRLGDRLIATHDVADTGTMFTGLVPPTIDRMFAEVRGAIVLAGLFGFPLLFPRRRRFGALGRFRLGLVGALAMVVLDASVPTVAISDCTGMCCDPQAEHLPAPPGSFFYHLDHLGSPELLTDSTGATLEHLTIRPWGTLAGSYEVDGSKRVASHSPFGLTGHRGDDGSGLVYFGARYYDPGLGLFLTHDPAGQFANPYMYVQNDPLNGVDPDGRFILGAIIVAFVLAFVATAIQAGVNGASAGEALKAGAIAGGMAVASTVFGAGVVSGVSTGIEKGAAAGFTASLLATALSLPVVGSVYSAVEGFRNGQYAVGAIAIVAIALTFYSAYSAASDPGVQAQSDFQQAADGQGLQQEGSAGFTEASGAGGIGASVAGTIAHAGFTVAGEIWNLPNTAIGLVYGGLGYVVSWFDGANPGVGFSNGQIQFTNNEFTSTAITFGDVGVYGTGPENQPQAMGTSGSAIEVEEYQHTLQGRILGPAYLPAHLILGTIGTIVGYSRGATSFVDAWHSPANILETGPHSPPARPW